MIMNDDNTSPKIHLTGRDRDIIEHVVRDRITTNEVIQSRYFDESHASAVTRATARLCAAGWLSAFPLLYPTKYFIPGKLTASAYGLPIGRTYPLGPQALPREFAVLKYTAANAPNVIRLSNQEILLSAAWYQTEWMQASHCQREVDSKLVLELIRVDLGGPADLIARKCRKDVEARRKLQAFTEMVAEGRFSMVVVTGSTAKAAAIQVALSQHRWPTNLQFRLAVFVSLIPLLPRSL